MNRPMGKPINILFLCCPALRGQETVARCADMRVRSPSAAVRPHRTGTTKGTPVHGRAGSASKRKLKMKCARCAPRSCATALRATPYASTHACLHVQTRFLPASEPPRPTESTRHALKIKLPHPRHDDAVADHAKVTWITASESGTSSRRVPR